MGGMKKNLEQNEVYLEERRDDSSHEQSVVEEMDDEEVSDEQD